MSVKPIPEGYSQVSPYLLTEKADEVYEFILKTFEGVDRGVMRMPDGTLAHGEIKIGDTVIMVSSCTDQYPALRSMVHVYVENSDETVARALASGGVEVRPVELQFYGDRAGEVKDPGGNSWWIATRVENVSDEEQERRMKEMRG